MSDIRYVVDVEQDLSSNDWVKLEKSEGPQYEEDSTVPNCRKCNVKFTRWWTRKHHCRYCGKIFCDECSSNYRVISPRKSANKVRVCNKCAKLLDLQSREHAMWTIFLCLDMKTIKTLCLRVCKSWFALGQKYLNQLYAIQYYQPSQPLSNEDTRLLLTNKDYLLGHRVWVLPLFRAHQDISFLMQKTQTVSCETLRCSPICDFSLSTSDFLHLIFYAEMDVSCMEVCCGHFYNVASDTEIECLVYLLVNKLITLSTLAYPNEHAVDPVLKLMIRIAERNARLQYVVYWEALFTDSQLLINAMENAVSLDFEQRQMLISIRKTFYGFSLINPNNIVTEINNLFKKCSHICLLSCGNPVNFNAIESNNIEIKKSKSRPVVLPLLTPGGPMCKYLFKQGDLIKDFVVCQIIDLMVFYIKRETDIKVTNTGYHVFLFNNNCALIEMVKDASTIYDIRNKLEMSILNYILDNNSNLPAAEIRRRFIDSLAVHLVITYLLGVGDRHLDNIMVHKSGHLFHIDFEYLLGDDPKIYNKTMRITYDMVDTIGGKKSKNYEEFRKKCSIVFNCLRKHTNIFITMLTVLNYYTNSKIVEVITQRFEPGENYLDCETFMKTLIDSSHDTVTTSIFDSVYKCSRFFH